MAENRIEDIGPATVRGENPLRVGVGVTLAGDRLDLTLDDAAAVVGVARTVNGG